MRGEIIILDLETTGLAPNSDEIIEIGLIRCQGETLLESYQSFVRPQLKSIPPEVMTLTGIQERDVRNAPPFRELVADIKQRIGTRPILGQRVGFDLLFLKPYGVGQQNVVIDTYELAALLLPTAARYNLTALMNEFGLVMENAHRALDDVMATWQVYRRLWERLLAIPLDLLAEITAYAKPFEWGAKAALEDALALRLQQGEKLGQPLTFPHLFAPSSPNTPEQRLKAHDQPQSLDVHALGGILRAGGQLAKTMTGYEARESQALMSEYIADAFNKGEHLIIEAPTGTGKSLAYLLPAAHWALKNGERVVVSTHTLTLQDQLLNQDLPFLQTRLALPIQAVPLKGRGNYLCPRRLETLRRRQPTHEDELRVLAKVLVWLYEGGKGERGELNLRGGGESVMWYRLSAQDEDCSQETCATQMRGACPLYKAKQAAERAHIVVVNHALLLSDALVENRLLPTYNYLVVDEAHQLEDAITESLLIKVDKNAFQDKLTDIGNENKGILGDLLASLKPHKKYYDVVLAFVGDLLPIMASVSRAVGKFFDELATILEESQDRDPQSASTRITPALRRQSGWARAALQWETLGQSIQALSEAMRKIYEALLMKIPDSIQSQLENFDPLLSSLRAAGDQLRALQNHVEDFIMSPQAERVYWVEVRYTERQSFVTLNSAPLHVGQMMQETLWESKHSVILTSATLQTANSFDYLNARLNAEAVKHTSLPSPFDYQKAALVYVPTDMPEPAQKRDYQRALEESLISLAAATHGRMLCLFTSYQQLKDTSQAITPRLALGGIVVFEQGTGSSKQALIDSFKGTEKAVLLGTRSFWEGVDLPGDDLSVVVMTKLPFAVPNDPIFAARSETYGEASFMNYAVPDAILRFRQGFGRLIRRKTDRGLVVIYDSRVINKRYGQLFLDSLPDVKLQRGLLAKLPSVAQSWLSTKE